MVVSKSKFQEKDLMEKLDFVMQFSQEKKPENGEDANVFSINKEAVLVSVFDGCGGSGARKHPSAGNKTSAYLASRSVAGAIRDWFDENAKPTAAERIRNVLYSVLQKVYYNRSHMWEEPAPRMINNLAKTLPSTAAFVVCTDENSAIRADCYWAGDSRLYLLDEDGLAQISVDDLNVTDAMESLYIGGKMTNVVHLPKDGENGFSVHHSQLRLKKSGILFAATDGCFDYITSPMEFEYLLLETLECADSAAEWEKNLKEAIGKIAQDDSTVTAASFGYGSFDDLKRGLSKRTKYLRQTYISQLDGLNKEQKTILWNKYKSNYYRL